MYPDSDEAIYAKQQLKNIENAVNSNKDTNAGKKEGEKPMMESKDLIAYCGLYCDDCFGYKGKIADLARKKHRSGS